MSNRNYRSWRWLYWLSLILSAFGTLYCLNLVIYHFWAAYVLPYQTALHIKWARHSTEILGLFVVLLIWFAFQLWRSRSTVK
jgi:hypothetical protein